MAGLALAGGLVLVSVSGAVLVLRSELEEISAPAGSPIAAGAPRPTLQSIVDAARRQHPGAQPTRLIPPDRPGSAARVAMRDGAGDAFDVLVDPLTTAVLASHWRERSPFHALHLLHTELYLGRRGGVLVALLGVGLVLQGATGLYLWWPFSRRAARGLGVRWRRPWPVVSYDLHKALGVCSLAFNVAIASTGVLLALSSLASGGAEENRLPFTATVAPTLDAIARASEEALPGGTLMAIQLPRAPGDTVTVVKRMPGEVDPRGRSAVELDPGSGTVLAVRDARRATVLEWIWNAVAPVHHGTFLGTISKLVYVAAALRSAVLVVTGVGVWLARSLASPGARGRAESRYSA